MAQPAGYQPNPYHPGGGQAVYGGYGAPGGLAGVGQQPGAMANPYVQQGQPQAPAMATAPVAPAASGPFVTLALSDPMDIPNAQDLYTAISVNGAAPHPLSELVTHPERVIKFDSMGYTAVIKLEVKSKAPGTPANPNPTPGRPADLFYHLFIPLAFLKEELPQRNLRWEGTVGLFTPNYAIESVAPADVFRQACGMVHDGKPRVRVRFTIEDLDGSIRNQILAKQKDKESKEAQLKAQGETNFESMRDLWPEDRPASAAPAPASPAPTVPLAPPPTVATPVVVESTENSPRPQRGVGPSPSPEGARPGTSVPGTSVPVTSVSGTVAPPPRTAKRTNYYASMAKDAAPSVSSTGCQPAGDACQMPESEKSLGSTRDVGQSVEAAEQDLQSKRILTKVSLFFSQARGTIQGAEDIVGQLSSTAPNNLVDQPPEKVPELVEEHGNLVLKAMARLVGEARSGREKPAELKVQADYPTDLNTLGAACLRAALDGAVPTEFAELAEAAPELASAVEQAAQASSDHAQARETIAALQREIAELKEAATAKEQPAVPATS